MKTSSELQFMQLCNTDLNGELAYQYIETMNRNEYCMKGTHANEWKKVKGRETGNA